MRVPFDLWGQRGRPVVEVVGESHYAASIRGVFGDGFRADGCELMTTAQLDPEPWNRYDRNAVGVWVGERQVGYLARYEAARYAPVLSSLVADGWAPQVGAWLWAAADQEGRPGVTGSVRIDLAEPHLIVPINEAPDQAHRLLPPGRAIQVIGDEQDLDRLPPRGPEGECWAHVTLHELVEPFSFDSRSVLEVRLDGALVGRLSPRMSAELLPTVRRLAASNQLTVARGLLKGSGRRPEVVLHAARSHELPDSWLDLVALGSTGTAEPSGAVSRPGTVQALAGPNRPAGRSSSTGARRPGEPSPSGATGRPVGSLAGTTWMSTRSAPARSAQSPTGPDPAHATWTSGTAEPPTDPGATWTPHGAAATAQPSPGPAGTTPPIPGPAGAARPEPTDPGPAGVGWPPADTTAPAVSAEPARPEPAGAGWPPVDATCAGTSPDPANRASTLASAGGIRNAQPPTDPGLTAVTRAPADAGSTRTPLPNDPRPIGVTWTSHGAASVRPTSAERATGMSTAPSPTDPRPTRTAGTPIPAASAQPVSRELAEAGPAFTAATAVDSPQPASGLPPTEASWPARGAAYADTPPPISPGPTVTGSPPAGATSGPADTGSATANPGGWSVPGAETAGGAPRSVGQRPADDTWTLMGAASSGATPSTGVPRAAAGPVADSHPGQGDGPTTTQPPDGPNSVGTTWTATSRRPAGATQQPGGAPWAPGDAAQTNGAVSPVVSRSSGTTWASADTTLAGMVGPGAAGNGRSAQGPGHLREAGPAAGAGSIGARRAGGPASFTGHWDLIDTLSPTTVRGTEPAGRDHAEPANGAAAPAEPQSGVVAGLWWRRPVPDGDPAAGRTGRSGHGAGESAPEVGFRVTTMEATHAAGRATVPTSARRTEHGAAENDPTGRGWSGRGPNGHGPAEHGQPHHGPAQHGQPHHGPAQHGQPHHGPAQHGPNEHGPAQHGPNEHGPNEHGPAQHGPNDHGPAQHRPNEHGPAQNGPTRHTPAGHEANHGPADHGPNPHGPAGDGTNDRGLAQHRPSGREANDRTTRHGPDGPEPNERAPGRPGSAQDGPAQQGSTWHGSIERGLAQHWPAQPGWTGHGTARHGQDQDEGRPWPIENISARSGSVRPGRVQPASVQDRPAPHEPARHESRGPDRHGPIPPPPDGFRFAVPPDWPEPPDGWTPRPGWRPHPSWPPAPVGWQWWVPYWD